MPRNKKLLSSSMGYQSSGGVTKEREVSLYYFVFQLYSERMTIMYIETSLLNTRIAIIVASYVFGLHTNALHFVTVEICQRNCAC